VPGDDFKFGNKLYLLCVLKSSEVPQMLLVLAEARETVEFCLCEALVQTCQLNELRTILIPDVT
jgi:hypothetical protein